MRKAPVSVIIPTYNRAGRITAAVRSVLEQSYQELEVIVVDDGSTDNTAEIVRSMADERIRYHRLEKNGGVSRARNMGVSLARYDLIAFNDSDDLWHPDKLEVQLNYWQDHPEDILVYCAYKVDLPGGEMIKIPSASEEPDTLSGEIFYYLLLRPTIGTPTMLLKKDLFEKTGGFDTAYPVMEDWEFTIRLARMGSIGYVDDILLTVEASAADRKSCVTSMSTKLDHYEVRCMLLARYLDEINEIGQFDTYAGDILSRAEKDGLTEQVKNMMMNQIARKTLGRIERG